MQRSRHTADQCARIVHTFGICHERGSTAPETLGATGSASGSAVQMAHCATRRSTHERVTPRIAVTSMLRHAIDLKVEISGSDSRRFGLGAKCCLTLLTQDSELISGSDAHVRTAAGAARCKRKMARSRASARARAAASGRQRMRRGEAAQAVRCMLCCYAGLRHDRDCPWLAHSAAGGGTRALAIVDFAAAAAAGRPLSSRAQSAAGTT